MQGFDLSTAQDIRLGSTSVSAVYLGNQLIWPSTPHDYSQDYLTLEATSNGDISFTLYRGLNDCYLQYSLDNGLNWQNVVLDPNIAPAPGWTQNINVLAGDKILIKGQIAEGVQPEGGSTTKFRIGATCYYKVYGNIMSLLYSDNFIGQSNLLRTWIFYDLFHEYPSSQNYGLINAENLILPATNLTDRCYTGLFDGCTNLTTAPVLPATTLANYCYNAMFWRCLSLTTAPVLPATTLAQGCYNVMFNMCSSLTTAPELPATTLVDSCYDGMFGECSNLNYVKCLATTDIATGLGNDPTYFLQGTATNGVFIKDANATWPNGAIPSLWTVIDA